MLYMILFVLGENYYVVYVDIARFAYLFTQHVIDRHLEDATSILQSEWQSTELIFSPFTEKAVFSRSCSAKYI